MKANLLRIAARLAVTGCLLATSSTQSSASIISVADDTRETELLEMAASPTLDTESVLRDLASGRYSGMDDSVARKRGPWAVLRSTARWLASSVRRRI